MPNKAEHPRTLANELVFIANNKKLVLTPINYYIVSADKRRQKAIREALLQSLSMKSWIDTSYYKSVSLGTKGGKYDPAMGELETMYIMENVIIQLSSPSRATAFSRKMMKLSILL